MVQKEISQKYFVTITLKPYMYSKTAGEQYDQTEGDLRKLCEYYDCGGKVVAELTKGFNIHYHGLIDFNTHLKYPQMAFIDNLRRLKWVGRSQIEPALHENDVSKYLSKDLKKTKDMILRDPIIYCQMSRVTVSYFIEDDKERWRQYCEAEGSEHCEATGA